MHALQCTLSLISFVFGKVFSVGGVHPYMTCFALFGKVLFNVHCEKQEVSCSESSKET